MQDAAKSTKAADALLPAGTLFGKYQIVRSIGVGGMGAVYEATHTLLKKPVALKTLHAVLATHDDHRTRFLREGEAVARIRHPNVVDVSDVGVQDGIPFLVMELMHGEDLHALLRREGPLDEKRAASLVIPVADGLAAAHAAGVIHRDLKPENIFLARDGKGEVRPKILDFGISKVSGLDGGFAVTSAGALLGTPYYMSPEQAEGSGVIDARSDQYALGVILYECTTGRLPFFQERLLDLLNAISQGVFQMPGVVFPGLDPNFENIILRAMATSPDSRFASVEELGRALLPYASSRVRAEYGPSLGVPAEGESSFPPPVARTSSPGDAPFARRVSSGGARRVSGEAATERPASAAGLRGRAGSAPDARTSSLPTQTGARMQSAPDVELGASQATPAPERPAAESPPSRRGLWGAVAAVALLLAVLGGIAVSQSHATHETTTAAPPRSVAATTPPTFALAIATDPANAALELDGEPAGVGHLSRTLPRDGREHVLRVRAEGFDERVTRFRDAPPPDDRVTLVATLPPPPPVVAPPTPPIAAPDVRPRHPRTPHAVPTGGAVPPNDIRLNR